MKILYYSEGFNDSNHPACSDGLNEIEFTEFELLTAAYTVGRRNRWEVFAFGPYSYYEMVYRTAMVLANVYESQDGYLEKTPAYMALDASEKSAVSYFLGLAVTKLMADKILGIPYLMHLEVFVDVMPHLRVSYRNGKSRPDLINVNRQLQSFIFECKGRSGSFDEKAFVKAKEQARMIRTVAGSAPQMNIGAQIFFDGRDEMIFAWKDPEPNKQGFDLDDLTPMGIVREYYRPFFQLVNQISSDVQENEIEINLTDLDLVIYLPKVIEELFMEEENSKTKVLDVLKRIPRSENFSKGIISYSSRTVQMNDGIRFEYGTSWEGRFNKKVK